MDPITASIAIGVVCVALVGYVVNQQSKPKNIFMGWEPGREGYLPKKVRSQNGPIVVKAGKVKTRFDLIPGSGRPRLDGKGMVWIGNLKTGQLMIPNADVAFRSTDGIYNELALADGRAKQLYNASNGNQDMLIKALIVMGALTLILMAILAWKFFQG